MAIRKGERLRRYLIGTNEADEIHGFGGNDTLRGRDVADLVRGGTGHDRVFGDTGNDYFARPPAGTSPSAETRMPTPSP